MIKNPYSENNHFGWRLDDVDSWTVEQRLQKARESGFEKHGEDGAYRAVLGGRAASAPLKRGETYRSRFKYYADLEEHKMNNKNPLTKTEIAAAILASPLDEMIVAAALANPYRNPVQLPKKNNPLIHVKFQRPGSMSTVAAHISTSQAEAVLTSEGLKRALAGEIVRPQDYKTEVYQAAAEGRQGLIRNPNLIGHYRSIPQQTQQRTVAVAALAVAAMAVMGRILRPHNAAHNADQGEK